MEALPHLYLYLYTHKEQVNVTGAVVLLQLDKVKAPYTNGEREGRGGVQTEQGGEESDWGGSPWGSAATRLGALGIQGPGAASRSQRESSPLLPPPPAMH